MNKSMFPLVALLFLFSSCSTPLQELIYLNGLEAGVTYEHGPQPEEYKIQPNDQLFIQVISDDPSNAAFLNLINSQSSYGSYSSSNSFELITYLVDEEGQINYPQLGNLNVGGKTTSEVHDMIQEEVDKYLESAAVFVKLVNRTVTVLGEVKSPGQKTMVKNQLTIFEALGSAGDITDYGNRQDVKIIRELTEGKHVEELDLTDPDLIYSPYYYILPHDIVYVEHKTKVYGAKNLSYSVPFSISASLISILAIILSL